MTKAKVTTAPANLDSALERFLGQVDEIVIAVVMKAESRELDPAIDAFRLEVGSIIPPAPFARIESDTRRLVDTAHRLMAQGNGGERAVQLARQQIDRLRADVQMLMSPFGRSDELDTARARVQEIESDLDALDVEIERAISTGDAAKVQALAIERNVNAPRRLTEARLGVLDLELERLAVVSTSPHQRVIDASATRDAAIKNLEELEAKYIELRERRIEAEQALMSARSAEATIESKRRDLVTERERLVAESEAAVSQALRRMAGIPDPVDPVDPESANAERESRLAAGRQFGRVDPIASGQFVVEVMS